MKECYHLPEVSIVHNNNRGQCVMLKQNTNNVFRLRYVEIDCLTYPVKNNVYCMKYKKDYADKKFEIPHGMSREDAFKVLSYLKDFVEVNFSLENNPRVTDKMTKLLDEFHFEILPYIDEKPFTDMLVVGGDERLFKNSEFSKRNFDWYSPNTTKNDVLKIYNKVGIDMSLAFEDDNEFIY